MAKHKFSWGNLPKTLLDAVAATIDLDGDPGESLRRRFGARPSVDFVRQAWPVLRDEWLAVDDESRVVVVGALRIAGLGDGGIEVGTVDGQMAYLRSCRNAPSLRRAVLDALVAAGERAPGPRTAMPTAAEVTDQVLALLRRVTENDQLEPDEDGDMALRFGSSAVFVRVFGEPPVIRVYAPMLTQIPRDPELADAIHALNRDSVFTKWVLIDDMVVVMMDLFGVPFSDDAVLQACEVVGNTADDVDDSLQTRFGGKTFFGEYAAPKLPAHLAGYL